MSGINEFIITPLALLEISDIILLAMLCLSGLNEALLNIKRQ